jgi:hypothetical protein
MDQGIDDDTGMPQGQGPRDGVAAGRSAGRGAVELSRRWIRGPTRDDRRRQPLQEAADRQVEHLFPKVRDGQMTSTKLDDLLAAKAFARQLLANWNQASISGTLTLTGCGYRPTAALGRPISGISGRDVDFPHHGRRPGAAVSDRRGAEVRLHQPDAGRGAGHVPRRGHVVASKSTQRAAHTEPAATAVRYFQLYEALTGTDGAQGLSVPLGHADRDLEKDQRPL